MIRTATAMVLVSLAVLVGCRQQEQTVLKLGHALDPGHAVHQSLVYLGERLEHYSSGQMRLDIYSGGQLGSERELMELLQIGSLAMTKVSASPMEGFVPAMKIFSIPYVFRDRQHYWQFLQSARGQALLTAGEDYRLRGLAYYDAGSRSFYTTEREVQKPSDLQGLKIRVQKSQTSVQMVETLGGAATPISWGELYTALQQGVVDGAENNPPSFYQSRHYEVSRYFILDEHTSVPDIILISTPIWEGMSQQQQTWLMQAVNDSVVFQKQLWQQQTLEALEAVKAAGVEVMTPDKSAFQRIARGMHDAIVDPELKLLLEDIQAQSEGAL